LLYQELVLAVNATKFTVTSDSLQESHNQIFADSCCIILFCSYIILLHHESEKKNQLIIVCNFLKNQRILMHVWWYELTHLN